MENLVNQLLNNNFDILLCIAFISSVIIVYTIIPTIVRVAEAKKLIDHPGMRKAHLTDVPTIGGIAIFAGILIPYGLFADFTIHKEFQYVIIAALILFFVGLKDDILVIAPGKKLSGQILASLIIIILANFRFTSLHGFWGIYQINYTVSVLLTLFVFLAIINGFNLIDGIDGLASAIGIISSLFFGIWFYINECYTYSIIAAATTGSLITFFIFNVFGKKHKIFMGDTGSLIIGLFMAMFAVKFNEMNININLQYHILSSPAVSFAILIVPLFDTLRVMIIRLIKKRSLFKPDKNHVHHKLLALGYSHLQATTAIAICNIIIAGCAFLLRNWGIIDLGMLVFGMALFFTILPEIVYFVQHKSRQSFL